LHGWLKVYQAGDRALIDQWLAMDAAAGQICHEAQKKEAGSWYLSSLTVDPSYQGQGLGSSMLQYAEDYARQGQGKQLLFFTNSQKNLDFYLKRGYEVFDERTIDYQGKSMGSWSLKKSL